MSFLDFLDCTNGSICYSWRALGLTLLWPIPLRYGCHHARHHGADPRLRVCERRAQGITDWLFELRVRRREVEKGSDSDF